jgi:hypothetical protein
MAYVAICQHSGRWESDDGLAIWVVRQLTKSHDHVEHGPSPLEVLDHRFARGEISLEDYTRDREVIRKAVGGKQEGRAQPASSAPR